MAFGFFVFVPKKEKGNQFSSQISLRFSLSLFILKSRGSLFLSEKMEMKIRDREKYSRDKKQEKPNKKIKIKIKRRRRRRNRKVIRFLVFRESGSSS
jgi:hypothetical protein